MNKPMSVEDYLAIMDKRAIDPEQRVIIGGKSFRALRRIEVDPKKIYQRRYKEKDRAKHAAKTKQWRADNADKVKAQKSAESNRNYHRPFIPVDCEGRDFPGHDKRDASGNVYPLHRVTLCGAGGWARLYSASDLDQGIGSPLLGNELPSSWLECPEGAWLVPHVIDFEFDS
jgi:hypothetical protein